MLWTISWRAKLIFAPWHAIVTCGYLCMLNVISKLHILHSKLMGKKNVDNVKQKLNITVLKPNPPTTMNLEVKMRAVVTPPFYSPQG